ncbi:DNA translocase FtsK [Sporosarcina sp. FA9]|uniref:DNA translocase FtsK n=1 Tax=Sporosarcina sp. FA9 TaxID=3413030 RepID=UPI003F65A8E4
MNKLFNAEEDTYDELNRNDDKQSIEDTESQLPLNTKPAFRFPIITDAEIYGWDDIETNGEQEQKYKEKYLNDLDKLEDPYEPTPLYENDRWPGEQISGKIFRAGDKLKYEMNSTDTTENFVPEKRTEKKVYEQEIISTPLPVKRSNKAFTPTLVPSPVFGFTKPTKIAVLPSKTEVIEDIEIKKTHILENDEQEKTSINIDDKVLISVQKEIVDEIIIEEQLELMPAIKSIEDDIEKAVENTIEKKERTVPFNVLMLKSDKEKMLTRKAEQKSEPASEPEPEPELEPIIQKTEYKIVEDIEKIHEDAEEEPLLHYVLPSLSYLIPPETQIEDTEWLESQSTKLVEALSHFAVIANVIEAVQGPTVTRFELTVGQGTKVSKIRNLTDDLKLALAAEDIRIQAPIPGKSSIGIEIPNRTTRPVRISEVLSTSEFQNSTSPMEAVLGLSLTGKPVTLDLRKMPHGMIAGATGSGKSVCINSILISLLYKADPTDLKMMLIDPKMVELAPFNGIPHLISPVITDVKAATAALKWAVAEMERRYELLAHMGVRDIERYNRAVQDSRRFSLKMPYLLIVIDELADLMMVAPADVEVSISRIAQKARACGIHLIIATQRPSVDVITGTIKANIPTRIAFSVSSQIDSRTILDTQGAERLLGRGDMLYIGNGQSSAVRLQGTFVTDDEIERIIEHVRSEAEPNYLFGQDDLLASAIEEEESDPLFEEACLFIYEHESASTSLLQRNFSIGYNRAAKLMDRMEKKGFISGQRGSKARDVFLTEKDLSQIIEMQK